MIKKLPEDENRSGEIEPLYQGKVLCKFLRENLESEDQSPISGLLLAYSAELLLIAPFNWDCFRFNGYAVLQRKDVTHFKSYPENPIWLAETRKKLEVPQPTPIPIDLTNWQKCLWSIGDHFPLFSVHPEQHTPGVCYVGYPLKVGRKELLLADLDTHSCWQKPRRVLMSHITRVDFGAGYESALAALAPKEGFTKHAKREG